MNKSGSAVVWIVAVVAGLGMVLFAASAPFNAKVKSVYRHTTQWTPKRIQADPSGYLEWAMNECNRFRSALEAHRLSLLARQHSTDRAIQESQARQESAGTLLTEAKELYRQTESEGAWPARTAGNTFSRDELKSRIIRLHLARQRQGRLFSEYTRLSPLIGQRLESLEQKITRVDDLQSWLASNVELVAMSRSVEDFRSVNDQVNALLDMSQAVSEAHNVPDVNTAVEENVEITATMQSFDAIMGER
jgi:hypothetical protein